MQTAQTKSKVYTPVIHGQIRHFFVDTHVKLFFVVVFFLFCFFFFKICAVPNNKCNAYKQKT